MSDVESVAGVAEHALPIATKPDADRARARLTELAADGGTVGVVGGGATGIEAATELAETHPRLAVRPVGRWHMIVVSVPCGPLSEPVGTETAITR